MSCSILTQEIRDYASQFKGETPETINNLLGLWWEANPKKADTLPEVEELKQFMTKLREPEVGSSESSKDLEESDTEEDSDVALNASIRVAPQNINLVLTPRIRKFRTTLLATLFTNTLYTLLDKKSKALEAALLDENLSTQQKIGLKKSLEELSIYSVLKEETPAGIFNNILNQFQAYVEAPEELCSKYELDLINKQGGAEKYSEERKLQAAKEKARYKRQEFQKIIDYFHPLAEEACNIILKQQGIRIDVDYNKVIKDTNNEYDSEDDSEDDSESAGREETVKEGWMSHFREISSKDRLSIEVKKLLSHIPKLNYKGKYEKDDLGYLQYLDSDSAHATLVKVLKDMVTAEDMIPLLEKAAERKPWILQIIKKLKEDDSLFSKFYHNYRLDTVNYAAQRTEYISNGEFKVKTFLINKDNKVSQLLDAWKNNYESGTLLDENSIYEKNGSVNRENCAKGLEILQDVLDLQHEWEKQGNPPGTFLEQPKALEKLMKVLNMVGIDLDPNIVKLAITTLESKNIESPGFIYKTGFLSLKSSLTSLLYNLKQGNVLITTTNGKNLLQSFNGIYTTIASVFSDFVEDSVESSIREGDKSYYTHVIPSYASTLIKQLKNISRNEESYKEFIEKEYGRYPWFFNKKQNHWYNGWLEELVKHPESRDLLDHKVLLHYDHTKYKDWNDLIYTAVLINEYLSDFNDKKTAWYPIPVLSNAPSAEFINFKRYTNLNDSSYKKVITEKLIELVKQELNRMTIVKQRDRDRLAGKNIPPIANFDIIRDKETGEIINLGGGEFKFLSDLNNLKFKQENGTIETFKEKVYKIIKNNPSDLVEFLEKTITDLMDDNFNKDYRVWYDMGLLEQDSNGNYINLPLSNSLYSKSDTARVLKKAQEILGDRFTPSMQQLLDIYNSNKIYDNRWATPIFEQIKEELSKKASEGIISTSWINSNFRHLKTEDSIKDLLEEYYWNHTYATSQIIQLFTTDLAFYKDMVDFYKRDKEFHSPTTRLNTSATFHGKPIGRKIEKTIYIKDEKIVSSAIANIEEILTQKINKGELTIKDKEYIISQFKKVNVTDAQAFRCLSSYRAVLGMTGQWTDEMETAYEHLKHGEWTMKDFDIILQSIKPFFYGQTNIRDTERNINIKTPIQHKNSEFLLLVIYDAIAGNLRKSEKLKAINAFMEKHQIDVVQFDSAVKVGAQGAIDLTNLKSEEEITNALNEATGLAYGEERPEVIHQVSYEDYGIQVATPEHGIDAVSLVGTQMRKLTGMDMADDIELNIGGKKLSKTEWFNLYHSITTENILEDFIKLKKDFSDPKNLEKILREELLGSSKYSVDLMKSCTLNENGEFTLPLFEPSQSRGIQQIFNSIIKNRITKQKIRGGALIQTSPYGLTDELHIEFEGKGKNKRIKYLDCYMPAYSRQFYEPLMDENGILNAEKLPEELRFLVGYRIPTEAQYSMAPLRVKGFLPQQNGSAIMLPAEITTLSGSDYDVDKLYVMVPEFDIKKVIDRKGIIKDILNHPKFKDRVLGKNELNEDKKLSWNDVAIIYDQIQAGHSFSEGSIEEEILKYYLTIKNSFTTTKIEKVKYDYNKPPQEQSRAARNNALIDLTFSYLTNSDTASKMLNPGNFDLQKKADRICKILDALTEEDLSKKGYTIEALLNLDLETLNELSEGIQKELNPLSPLTQVTVQQMNMSGINMTGIYANHIVHNALAQQTSLALHEQYGAFTYAGRKLTSLHKIQNDKKQFISKILANFVGASVDSAKDNTLFATNQNSFTGDASLLMARLGYSPTEIAILMKQPIVMEMTREFFKKTKISKPKKSIISTVISNTAKTIKMQVPQYNPNQDFALKTLMKDILLHKKIKTVGNKERLDFYRRQIAVGLLFERITNSAESLADLVHIMKADTDKGAAGPTIADNIAKMQRFLSVEDSFSHPEYPLVNSNLLNPDISVTIDPNTSEEEQKIAEDKLRKSLLKTKLPYVQAFFTLGLQQTESLFKQYFPQYNRSFMKVLNGNPTIGLDGLVHKTSTGKLNVKTINSIYDDLFIYILSKTEFFGDGVDKRNNKITAEYRRDMYINQFPDWFTKVVSENKDIQELGFIQQITVKRPNKKVPIKTLSFKNNGKLTTSLKEQYIRDWATLLHMNNPTAEKLAYNLVLYNYYRKGFAFGPNTFNYLIPMELKQAIPGYISTLRELLDTEDDYSLFIRQYIYNHLDNRAFVPLIPEESSVKFIKDGKIKEFVSVHLSDQLDDADRKFVKVKYSGFQQKIDDFVFQEFIGTEVKNKKGESQYIYYELTESYKADATYQRIDPLGIKDNFLEYQYGVPVDEMYSVIEREEFSSEDMSDGNIEEKTEISEKESLMDKTSLREAEIEATANAFYETYGEKLNLAETKTGSILDIAPKEDYKDANDDIICESKLIKTF